VRYSTATLVSVYKIISTSGSSYIGPFLYDVFEGVSFIYRFCEIYS